MNATQLLELMNATPFQPLEVRLNSGTVIHVEDPYSIAVKPNSATCIIFDDDGIARFVSYIKIAKVVTKDLTAM